MGFEENDDRLLIFERINPLNFKDALSSYFPRIFSLVRIPKCELIIKVEIFAGPLARKRSPFALIIYLGTNWLPAAAKRPRKVRIRHLRKDTRGGRLGKVTGLPERKWEMKSGQRWSPGEAWHGQFWGRQTKERSIYKHTGTAYWQPEPVYLSASSVIQVRVQQERCSRTQPGLAQGNLISPCQSCWGGFSGNLFGV